MYVNNFPSVALVRGGGCRIRIRDLLIAVVTYPFSKPSTNFRVAYNIQVLVDFPGSVRMNTTTVSQEMYADLGFSVFSISISSVEESETTAMLLVAC